MDSRPVPRVAILLIPFLLSVPAITAAPAAAQASVISPQQAGVTELMSAYYNPSTGLIGPSWWQSAVALSTVETYQQATADPRYYTAITTPFATYGSGNDPAGHPHFENGYTDDTAWWGLA